MTVVIGVDGQSTRIAVTAIKDGYMYVYYHLDMPKDTIGRCSEAFCYAASISDMYAFEDDDVRVYVEKPFANTFRSKTTLELSAVHGAFLAGLNGHASYILRVDNKTWKKHVLGNGNADKDAIMSYALQIPDIKIVIEDAPNAIKQDIADSACIALYGDFFSAN